MEFCNFIYFSLLFPIYVLLCLHVTLYLRLNGQELSVSAFTETRCCQMLGTTLTKMLTRLKLVACSESAEVIVL